MPNTREKLIELIRCADFHPVKGTVRTVGSQFCAGIIADIADHLIANGVTVLDCKKDCANCWKTKLVNAPNRWIPVTERLPDKNVRVLCYRPGQFYEMVVAKLDDYGWERWGKDHDGRDVITHWMPLPEIPKEV